MQSGKLHAEDKDFNTAFSYFIEALDGYHTQDEPEKATAALQYMLLCKIMLNLTDDIEPTHDHQSKHSSMPARTSKP